MIWTAAIAARCTGIEFNNILTIDSRRSVLCTGVRQSSTRLSDGRTLIIPTIYHLATINKSDDFLNFIFRIPPPTVVVIFVVAVFMGAFHCKSCHNGENVTNMFGQHGADGSERRRFIFGRRRSRSGSVRQTDSLVLQTLSIIKNLGLIEK